jgi:AcrR family transcriptional regulator
MGEPSDTGGTGPGGTDPTIDLRDGARRSPGPDASSETRARLVQAAAEIFGEQGYTGTRVADIARRAGYTSGALYSYFDSRAALLAEAIAAENDRLLRELTDGLGDSGAPPAADIAATLALLLSAPISAADQLLLDGLAICPREPEAQERIGAAVRRVVEQFERRLSSNPARPGSHLEDDPAAVSFLLVVFLAGATAVRAAGLQDLVPEQFEPLLAGVIDHLGAPIDLGADGIVGPPAGP